MARDRDAEEKNRTLWDEITRVHLEAYPVEEFQAGKTTLKPVELGELTDVRGKDLLHLQCHFGLDTLSWARLGAKVTGIDFSAVAVKEAQRLARRAGLDARFLCHSVYGLPGELDGRFDIVYTSIGVLPWLGDLGAWARNIHRVLRPGGRFYIHEAHPFTWTLDDEVEGEPSIRYSWFHSPEGTRFPPGADYADPGYRTRIGSHEWQWSMADIVNSLLDAGLRLCFLHEHPAMPYAAVPGMVKDDDGSWHFRGYEGKLPLAFSILAVRPA